MEDVFQKHTTHFSTADAKGNWVACTATVNTSFGGHGVGRTMHEVPDVPNAGTAGRGPRLRAGLVIAIEPWFLAGDGKIRMDKDGWTIRSADRSRGVHVEHTVAVTPGGPLVLTARDRG